MTDITEEQRFQNYDFTQYTKAGREISGQEENEKYTNVQMVTNEEGNATLWMEGNGERQLHVYGEDGRVDIYSANVNDPESIAAMQAAMADVGGLSDINIAGGTVIANDIDVEHYYNGNKVNWIGLYGHANSSTLTNIERVDAYHVTAEMTAAQETTETAETEKTSYEKLTDAIANNEEVQTAINSVLDGLNGVSLDSLYDEEAGGIKIDIDSIKDVLNSAGITDIEDGDIYKYLFNAASQEGSGISEDVAFSLYLLSNEQYLDAAGAEGDNYEQNGVLSNDEIAYFLQSRFGFETGDDGSFALGDASLNSWAEANFPGDADKQAQMKSLAQSFANSSAVQTAVNSSSFGNSTAQTVSTGEELLSSISESSSYQAAVTFSSSTLLGGNTVDSVPAGCYYITSTDGDVVTLRDIKGQTMTISTEDFNKIQNQEGVKLQYRTA